MHMLVIGLAPQGVNAIEHVEKNLSDYFEDCSDQYGPGGCSHRGHKYDWHQIGGRWTGWLDGYDPDKDPKNLEPSGKAVWPTRYAPHEGDVGTVEQVIAKGKLPAAILTEDGTWIDEELSNSPAIIEGTMKNLLEAKRGLQAVVLDCHT